MGSRGADLHVHSRRSDGTHEPARVVELAAESGLEGVSLTDHDTVAGLEEALEAGRRLGVRVLTGVELSAEYRDREIHVLAYGFDPTDPGRTSIHIAACHLPAARRLSTPKTRSLYLS